MTLARRLSSLLLALACGCAGERPAIREARAPEAVPAPTDGFEPGGVGSLVARTSSGDSSLVGLSAVHVSARQRGDMAEVEATHVFHSDADAVLEGTFRFPMPDGALLTGLAMMIDGKLMEGELVEREKARKAYEAVVDGMQDPALLEWEHGSLFKMRVFPIEPRRDKVVTIRYLAPLNRGKDGLEFLQTAEGPSGSADAPALSLDWEGERVFDEKHVDRRRVVSVPAAPASAILREYRPDASYALLRLRPDWSRVPPPSTPPAKSWFLLVDTSRSTLEERPRQLEALRVVLASLPPGARFQLLTSDLETRTAPGGWRAVTPEAVEQAQRFVESVTPDGASDLGHAFEVVGGLARSTPDSALLYLGDCEPTWGVTRSDELSPLLTRALPGTPFFPLLLGASVDDELASDLASRSGGRVGRARRREELEAFAHTLPTGVKRLDRIEVVTAPGTQALPQGPLSLEQGHELLLLLKAPPERDQLAGLGVHVRVGAASLSLVPRERAERTTGIARRFGAALVRRLEQTGQPGPEIVKASHDYGVMSKLTSFLVLESDEAYARFAIERRKAEFAEAPRVTGASLESSESADISADRVQPGDPEIWIDAERDALSVKVELPFGETKLASYDPDARGGRGAWLVRFLVPRNTPEGEYEARASIQHADGSLETRRVRYTVDDTAPELEIALKRSARRPGLIEVSVTQPRAGALSDLKRVELRTPQGTIHQLSAIRWGAFRVFVPATELRRGTLRVVGFDQALNHTVKELELP